MAEPVVCKSCRRPFNARFTACPFCKTEVTASAPAAPAAPLTCGACRRPYKASFAACPFCGADPAYRPPPPAQEPDWAALADQAIASCGPLLPLEFHPAAVAALDAFFDITWGTEGKLSEDPSWQPNQAQSALILRFGGFIGELLRREFGGRWEFNRQNAVESRVVYGKRYTMPLLQALLRMGKGRQQAFEQPYLEERISLGRRGTAAEAEGWLRYARHFEKIQRNDLATAFCARGLALSPLPPIRAELEGIGERCQSAEVK